MTKNRILLSFCALLVSTLACTIFIGGPEYPDQHISVSAEAVDSLKSEIEAAVLAGTETGQVTLNINEEQLTSYMAYKLASQNTPAFNNPQVYLDDQQMKIYGIVARGNLSANILFILSVSVDEAGEPKIEISSADFGPFPAPDSLKQTITTLITEAYTGTLGPIATGFRLERITIDNGIMTVAGRIK